MSWHMLITKTQLYPKRDTTDRHFPCRLRFRSSQGVGNVKQRQAMIRHCQFSKLQMRYTQRASRVVNVGLCRTVLATHTHTAVPV